MNDRTIRPLQRSAPVPAITSAQFLAQWLEERGLDPAFGRYEPGSSFFASFTILTHDADGNERPELSRTRYDRQEKKYMAKPGVGVAIFAPRPDSFKTFAAAKEKWIAEGEGKALKLAQLGYPVLGIGGCENWHPGGDKYSLHPDLRTRIKPGDVVHIAIDGDWKTKELVRTPSNLLLFAVKATGAKPLFVDLPPDDGIDDFLTRVERQGKDPHKELAALPRLTVLQAAGAPMFNADAAHFPNLFAERPPQPPFIVSGILPKDVGVLSATGGMGKTTMMLWMSVHIILGRKLLGHDVERSGGVLFLTGEDNREIFQHRLYNICEQLELSAAERAQVCEKLYVEDLSDRVARFAEVDARGNLAPTDLVDNIVAEYSVRGICLAICDPLISFSPGERFVNDGAQALVQQARRLCHGLNAAVMLINHVSKVHAQNGKAAQHAGRGGTAIGDGCRFEYELQPSTDKELQPLYLELTADAKAYSLYVHKLSHAARPELPYIVVRNQWSWTWAERTQQTAEQTELRRREAVERDLQGHLNKLILYMRGLDTAAMPVTRNSLQDVCKVVGVPKNAIPAVVTFGLQTKALEERELPAHHRVGKRTHGLHLPAKKYGSMAGQ